MKKFSQAIIIITFLCVQWILPLQSHAQDPVGARFSIEGLDCMLVDIDPTNHIATFWENEIPNGPHDPVSYELSQDKVTPVEIEYLSYIEGIVPKTDYFENQITVGNIIDSQEAGPFTGMTMYIRELGQGYYSKLELISPYLNAAYTEGNFESSSGYSSRDYFDVEGFMAGESVPVEQYQHTPIEENQVDSEDTSNDSSDIADFAKQFVGGGTYESGSNNGDILPQSNQVYLSQADIAHLSAKELNYARNEIFARHGRMFKSQELRNYFCQFSWYHPSIAPDAFDENDLPELERHNALLLLHREQALGMYLLD